MGRSVPISGSALGGLLKVLERHATAVLVLAVAVSAFMLWDAYVYDGGWFFGTSLNVDASVLAWEPSTAAAASSEAATRLQPPPALWFPAYSFKTLVVIAHVLGLVMSFGAVMFLDLFLVRYLLFRPVPGYAYDVANFGSWLVIAGLTVMWLTGLTFLLIYWSVDPIKLDNPKIWAKVVVVSLLTINGMLIHNRILPMLKVKVGRRILEGESAANARIILATGAISFASWMFAVILGLSKELNFTVSSLSLLLAYALFNVAIYIGMNGMVTMFDRLQSPKP